MDKKLLLDKLHIFSTYNNPLKTRVYKSVEGTDLSYLQDNLTYDTDLLKIEASYNVITGDQVEEEALRAISRCDIDATSILSSDYTGLHDIHAWTENVDAIPDFEYDEVITNRQGVFYTLVNQYPLYYLYYALQKETLDAMDYDLLFRIFSKLQVITDVNYDVISQVNVKAAWTLLKKPQIVAILFLLSLKELINVAKKDKTSKELLKTLCTEANKLRRNTNYIKPMVWTLLRQTRFTECIQYILAIILSKKNVDKAKNYIAQILNSLGYAVLVAKLDSGLLEAELKLLQVPKDLRKSILTKVLIAEHLHFENLLRLYSTEQFNWLVDHLYILLNKAQKLPELVEEEIPVA